MAESALFLEGQWILNLVNGKPTSQIQQQYLRGNLPLSAFPSQWLSYVFFLCIQLPLIFQLLVTAQNDHNSHNNMCNDFTGQGWLRDVENSGTVRNILDR